MKTLHSRWNKHLKVNGNTIPLLKTLIFVLFSVEFSILSNAFKVFQKAFALDEVTTACEVWDLYLQSNSDLYKVHNNCFKSSFDQARAGTALKLIVFSYCRFLDKGIAIHG